MKSPDVVGTLALRVGRFGAALSDAYSFGAIEGTVGEPWLPPFQAAAFDLYHEHFSPNYLKWLATVFADGAESLESRKGLGQDAQIVASYLSNCAAAIIAGLTHQGRLSVRPDARLHVRDRTPPVMPFTELAHLTTRDAASRLQDAGFAVNELIGVAGESPLEADESSWLQDLVAGFRVLDIAADAGLSERTLYRKLDNLYRKLGAANRREAIALAVRQGWI